MLYMYMHNVVYKLKTLAFTIASTKHIQPKYILLVPATYVVWWVGLVGERGTWVFQAFSEQGQTSDGEARWRLNTVCLRPTAHGHTKLLR